VNLNEFCGGTAFPGFLLCTKPQVQEESCKLCQILPVNHCWIDCVAAVAEVASVEKKGFVAIKGS
jgi:hypothetical protein